MEARERSMLLVNIGESVPFARQMRLIVVAAGDRDVREARPLVRNEAACSLEPEHTGGQFGRNTDRLSKALAEMPPAIADFIPELLDRRRPVGFRQSSPRPRDFGLRAG